FYQIPTLWGTKRSHLKKHQCAGAHWNNSSSFFRNRNGTPNQDGVIDIVVILNMKIGNHKERTIFMVTNIGPEDVIIGIIWLWYHNPIINWYE
ncbi:hypothetical protein BC835DRAFT_1457125, partial [Cytidiella melzeri]